LPKGTKTTRKVEAYRLKNIDAGYYEKDPSLWVERLVDFWCWKHCDAGAKAMYTARCPKTSPRGLGASQVRL